MRFSAPPPETSPSYLSSSSSLSTRTNIIIATTVSLATLLLIASTGGLINTTTTNNSNQASSSPIIILSAPHHDLFELCRREIIETPEGWKRCRSLCRHTGCCFLRDEASCLETNGDVCRLYAPCEEYYEYDDVSVDPVFDDDDGDGSSVEMPPAPGNIYDICSYKNIGTIDGFDECINVCLHSECCTATSPLENCRERHVDLCDDYEPCDILNPVRTKIPTLHMAIDDDVDDDDVANVPQQVGYLTDDDLKILITVACSEEEIRSQSGGRQPCANLCRNKSCCITNSCGEEEGDCDGFENCMNLGKVLDEGGMSSLSQDWSLTGLSNSEDEDESWSEEDDDDDDDDRDEEDDDDVYFSVKNAVDSTCDEANFNDPQAFKRCKNLCSTKMCCFSKQSEHCRNSPIERCEDYESCQFLLDYLDYDDTSSTTHAELIEATCDKNLFRLSEQFKKCKKVCKGHMCCFHDGETNCVSHPKKKCGVYEPCRGLYDILTKEKQHSGDDSGSQSSLDDTLSKSSEDDVVLADDDVTTMLKPGAMVPSSSEDDTTLDSPTNSPSATDTGASTSNDLTTGDASSISSDDFNKASAEVQALIDKTCTDDIFQRPNDFEDCEEICELHMCCFKDGNESCRDDREGKYDCSVYNSCQILIGGWRYTPGHGQ